MDKEKVRRARRRKDEGYYERPDVIDVVVARIVEDLGDSDNEEPLQAGRH